jgi:hypothetical protein
MLARLATILVCCSLSIGSFDALEGLVADCEGELDLLSECDTDVVATLVRAELPADGSAGPTRYLCGFSPPSGNSRSGDRRLTSPAPARGGLGAPLRC